MRAPICAALAGVVLAAAPAYGASQTNNDGCRTDSPDRTIVLCTQIINDSDETQLLRAVAYFHRGTALASKGEFSRADQDFANAIRLDAKLPEYFFNRGTAWQIKGELERALAEFNAAIRLNPRYARAYTQRGRIWYLKGGQDRAIGEWNEAIRLDSDHAAAFENRGAARLTNGEYDSAIADLSEAIRIAPQHARVYFDRGRAWYAKADYDRAISDYTEAIGLDAKSSLFFFNRGLALNAKADNDAAIKDFTEALRIDPKHVEAYRQRGQSYFFTGNFAAASADLRYAAGLSGDIHLALWRYLARARMREDGLAELNASASRMKSKEWPYPVVNLYLGRSSLEEMRASARLERMRTVTLKSDEACQAEFYAGQWYLLQGNKIAAINRLKAAAESCAKDRIEYSGAIADLKRLAP